jgi:hypothetical protein
MMRRLLAFLLRPVFFFGLRFMSLEPWERLGGGITPQRFGTGSRHDFRWYFEGESAVRVDNIDAVCDWLAECEYVRDPDLFHEPDFWQHPGTFEQLRKGDCEDHALWAWRKLTELGIPAEFYVGRWRTEIDAEPGFHAWVVCKHHGIEYLLEATEASRDRILRPLDEVRADYFPHFAIDAQFASVAFGGYLLYLKEEHAKRKRKTDARAA